MFVNPKNFLRFVGPTIIINYIIAQIAIFSNLLNLKFFFRYIYINNTICQ